MAREKKGREKNGDHTISQPSRVFPVTPDVPPLKGSGIYLLLELWTMKQAFFFFFVHVFGCHFRPNFPRAVFSLWTFWWVVSVVCVLTYESWTTVLAPLHHYGTCDRGSHLPWCVQPYSEIHRTHGLWPTCAFGGQSPVLVFLLQLHQDPKQQEETKLL